MSRPASEISLPATNNMSFDPRIVKLSIEVNGKIKTYQDLFISAVGVKYGNPLQNEAEITIYNLDRETQDYILSETTPYNSNFTPKSVILEAGRESYGTTVIYYGNIIMVNPTQPPDIGIILRCLTGNFLKSTILTRTQPGTIPLETIANAIAEDIQVSLEFQATNKMIANHNYSGSALQQLEVLASYGLLNVFVDDDKMVVKNANDILQGNLRDLSSSTGLIGIPEFIERGVRVKFFIDNKTRLGGGINLRSELYPAVNGVYVIYQLAFVITNRLTPFYYIADCAWVGHPNEESTSG